MFKPISLKEVFIFKNILIKNDLHNLYNTFINNNTWSLSPVYIGDNTKSSYPWLNIFNNGNIINGFLYAYSIGLVHHLNYFLDKEYKFSLNVESIKRVVVNAQRKGDSSYMHQDGSNDDITCVFFTTPEWDKNLGGELQIKEQTIEYDPGTCVIFNSSLPHDAKPILLQSNLYRTSLAITFKTN